MMPVVRSKQEERIRSERPLDPIPLAPLAPSAPRPPAPVAIEEPAPGSEVESSRRRSKPLLLVGLIAGSCASMFFLSIRSGYLLGQIAAPVFLLSGLHGIWRGALRKMVMLPVSVGLVYLVTSQVDFADPVIRLMAGKSSLIGNAIACGLAVVLTVVIVGSIVKTVRDRLARNRPFLLTADRLLGAGLGLTEAAIVMLCLCWSVVLVVPQANATQALRPADPGSMQHVLATGLIQLTDEIDRGPFRSIVRDHNLLEDIPAVREALSDLPSNSSSPDWHEKITEFSRKSDQNRESERDTPFQQYRRANRQRDNTYRSLPSPKNRGQ